MGLGPRLTVIQMIFLTHLGSHNSSIMLGRIYNCVKVLQVVSLGMSDRSDLGFALGTGAIGILTDDVLLEIFDFY